MTHVGGRMQMESSNWPADLPRGMVRRSNLWKVVIEVGNGAFV